MKISKTKFIVCLFLSFLIGWYVGLVLENWAFVTVYFDVQAVSLFTTCLTLGVTVYVAKKIQRTTQNSNNQKQFLVSRIGELDKAVSELEGVVTVDGFSYKLVISKFMSLYLSLRRTLDNINSIYPIIGELRKKEVLNEWRTVENVATYTPLANANVMITINNDKVSYNPSKRSEVISKLSDFRKILFDLQVEVYKG